MEFRPKTVIGLKMAWDLKWNLFHSRWVIMRWQRQLLTWTECCSLMKKTFRRRFSDSWKWIRLSSRGPGQWDSPQFLKEFVPSLRVCRNEGFIGLLEDISCNDSLGLDCIKKECLSIVLAQVRPLWSVFVLATLTPGHFLDVWSAV